MTIRIGMIGAGAIARKHMRNFDRLEGAKLVAVSDLSDDALLAAESAYRTRGYKDYREMLEKEALDAVYIAVPPFAHGDMEERVAAKGIPLFVEKPVALHLEAAKRKYEAIREAGIIHASGYCLRYIDAVEKAKAYLADKVVGMALAYRIGKSSPIPWFGTMSKSGGQLVDAGTHQVDLMRYLIGDITEVYAKMKLRHLHYLDNYDISDVGTATFEFACGAIGSIATSTAQPHDSRQSVDIMGEDFRVVVDPQMVVIVEKGVTVAEIPTTNDKFLEEDRLFLEAVRTGDQCRIKADYGEGVKTLAVTLAANLSAETGRPIRIGDTNELTVL